MRMSCRWSCRWSCSCSCSCSWELGTGSWELELGAGVNYFLPLFMAIPRVFLRFAFFFFFFAFEAYEVVMKHLRGPTLLYSTLLYSTLRYCIVTVPRKFYLLYPTPLLHIRIFPLVYSFVYTCVDLFRIHRTVLYLLLPRTS